MGFAHAADLPVVLIGDIDRGHVIASLVGAHAVLDDADRARIRGFIINKFRGDISLFRDGLTTIEARTGWRALGVVPWMPGTLRLPAEDAMQLERFAHGTARSDAGHSSPTPCAAGRRSREDRGAPASHRQLRRLRSAQSGAASGARAGEAR